MPSSSTRSVPAMRRTAQRHESNPLVPRYDAMLHELRLGDEVVKRFTRPAPAQELILKVLEEERWPPAIDDPLFGASPI